MLPTIPPLVCVLCAVGGGALVAEGATEVPGLGSIIQGGSFAVLVALIWWYVTREVPRQRESAETLATTHAEAMKQVAKTFSTQMELQHQDHLGALCALASGETVDPARLRRESKRAMAAAEKDGAEKST